MRSEERRLALTEGEEGYEEVSDPGFCGRGGDGAHYRLPEEGGGSPRGRAGSGSPGGRRGDWHGRRRPRPRPTTTTTRHVDRDGPGHDDPPLTESPSASSIHRGPRKGASRFSGRFRGRLNSIRCFPSGRKLSSSPRRVYAAVRALRLRRRVGQLETRLQTRERESHFLGESPDPRVILQHAYRAAAEILPLARFDLYRVDSAQRITRSGRSRPRGRASSGDRTSVAGHEKLGQRVDSRAVELQFAATETDRSFAPSDLLPGAEPTQVLHLPLYSGDALVAYLILGSPRADRRAPQGRDPRAAGAADGLAPRLPQLGDRRDGRAVRPLLPPLLRDPLRRRVGAAPALRRAPLGRALRPRPLQEVERHARPRRRRHGDPAFRRDPASGRPRRPTSHAATAARSLRSLFPETSARSALCGRRPGAPQRRAGALRRDRPFRVTVSAGVADTQDLEGDDRHELLVRADKALYFAKDKGRNRARLYSGRSRASATRR